MTPHCQAKSCNFTFYKVQMGMYCKSSRLNSFVTKGASVEILFSAVHRDPDPYFTILPLTEVWRNRWRLPPMSPECLCPIENGFHVECGSNGPWATKGLPFPTLCNVSMDEDTSNYTSVYLRPLEEKFHLN